MNFNPLISIILPVHNRPDYLKQAIESVIQQTYNNWELILADDKSKLETHNILKKYESSKIKIKNNKQNLGLFANLNRAINSSQGDYIVLLCSDDFLLPHCLQTLASFTKFYAEIGLYLTSFNVVDDEGKSIPSGSIAYNQKFVEHSPQAFVPAESIPLLLKWGSINGNLTGMCFSRELFQEVGGFREDWKHAADWEWVHRACTASLVLISLEPIAVVREHKAQLSRVNFKNISNSLEVIEMVNSLLNDPHMANIKQSQKWALHILQFHLWFALKFAAQGKWKESCQIVKSIDKVTGIGKTFWQLLKWLPSRWQIYSNKFFFPMPPQ
jgi:glycosyltransferase involved in cell wall biosynthesis